MLSTDGDGHTAGLSTAVWPRKHRQQVEAIQDMEEQRSGLGVGVWMWESKVVIVEAVLLGRLHVPTM